MLLEGCWHVILLRETFLLAHELDKQGRTVYHSWQQNMLTSSFSLECIGRGRARRAQTWEHRLLTDPDQPGRSEAARGQARGTGFNWFCREHDGAIRASCVARCLAVAHHRKEAGLYFEGKYVQSRRRDTTRCMHRQAGDGPNKPGTLGAWECHRDHYSWTRPT